MNKILKFTRRGNSNINGYVIELINVSHITNVCLETNTISIYVDESLTIPSGYCFKSEQAAKKEFDRIENFLLDDIAMLEVQYD